MSSGEKASEDLYTVKVGLDEDGRDNPQQSTPKKLKLSPNNSEAVSFESGGDSDASTLVTKTATGLEDSKLSIGQTVTSPRTSASVGNNVSFFDRQFKGLVVNMFLHKLGMFHYRIS